MTVLELLSIVAFVFVLFCGFCFLALVLMEWRLERIKKRNRQLMKDCGINP